MKLYKRNVVDQIIPYLGDETIVVLHGARQVGKTHILYYLRDHLLSQAKLVFYYDLEYPELLTTLNLGPEEFIRDLVGRGYKADTQAYVLIDEIQYLDNPSSFLKIMADHYKSIHLIVSGSSSFDIKSKFTDSLVGRTTDFEIFPLSFSEFLTFRESKLNVKIAPSPATLKELVALYGEFVRYGGYPQIVLEPIIEKKHKNLLQIIDTYIRKDLRDLATIGDIQKFNNLIRLLAYQSGQLLNYNSICNETKLSYPTLQKYLSILEETYIIKLVHPYSHNPSIEISKNPKIFFFDSGLQSLLWQNQFVDNLQGNTFETNIFGELVKKYGRSNIGFWRTKNGTEVDFIIEGKAKPLPIEVKTTFPITIPNGLASFSTKYLVYKHLTVSLQGTKKSSNMIYPWEL
jgi:hypothetical protein